MLLRLTNELCNRGASVYIAASALNTASFGFRVGGTCEIKMATLASIFFGIVALGSLATAIGPLGSFGVGVGSSKCELSLTTASGTYVVHKPNGQFCSGDLIFEDTFELFDLRKWQHENTLAGNGVSICVKYWTFRKHYL